MSTPTAAPTASAPNGATNGTNAGTVASADIVEPVPQARVVASPEDLPRPGDAPDRAMLEQFLSQWPGGEHILPHVDSGPWHLTAVSTWDGATWRIREALAAYPPLAQLKIRGWDGDPELRLVFAVPSFARRLMEWEDGDDGFVLDWNLDVPAYQSKPGLTELADLIPTWMGLDGPQETMDALRAAFRAAFSTVGPEATMELIGASDPDGDMAEGDVLSVLRAMQHPRPA